jgi:hypothetical protein
MAKNKRTGMGGPPAAGGTEPSNAAAPAVPNLLAELPAYNLTQLHDAEARYHAALAKVDRPVFSV